MSHAPTLLETLRRHDVIAGSPAIKKLMTDFRETFFDVDAIVQATTPVGMLNALWDMTHEIYGGRRILAAADVRDAYMESCEIIVTAYEELSAAIVLHVPTLTLPHRKAC